MGLKTVVTFDSVTGQPVDRCVNTFAIKTQGDDHESGKLEALHAAIMNFYTAVPTGGTAAVASYLSGRLSRAANDVTINTYDITGKLFGEPHGSPIKSTLHTLTPIAGADSLPLEVAACFTLEAINRADQLVETPDGPDAGFQVDRPRQRFTGRVYLGPLATNAGHTEATISHLNGTFQANVHKAFSDLAIAIGNIPTAPAVWDLGVWSRADGTIRAAEYVSSDYDWDTQRRRGLSSATRTRFAL